MPYIKINKQLNRPDGGKITSGSVATSNPSFDEGNMRVIFPTYLYVSEASKNEGKAVIPACVELTSRKSMPKRLVKQCTIEEWEAINLGANAGILTMQWFQTCIDEVIGAGFTEEL